MYIETVGWPPDIGKHCTDCKLEDTYELAGDVIHSFCDNRMLDFIGRIENRQNYKKTKSLHFSESQPILGGRRSTTTTGHVLAALDFCGRGGQKRYKKCWFLRRKIRIPRSGPPSTIIHLEIITIQQQHTHTYTHVHAHAEGAPKGSRSLSQNGLSQNVVVVVVVVVELLLFLNE